MKVSKPGEPTATQYIDKSAAYLECEPLFAQGRIDLLDHPTLAREFKLLERRPRAGGRTQVDHPRGQHDDHANSLALAAAVAARSSARPTWHPVAGSKAQVIGHERNGTALVGGQAAHLRGLYRPRR